MALLSHRNLQDIFRVGTGAWQDGWGLESVTWVLGVGAVGSGSWF